VSRCSAERYHDTPTDHRLGRRRPGSTAPRGLDWRAHVSNSHGAWWAVLAAAPRSGTISSGRWPATGQCAARSRRLRAGHRPQRKLPSSVDLGDCQCRPRCARPARERLRSTQRMDDDALLDEPRGDAIQLQRYLTVIGCKLRLDARRWQARRSHRDHRRPDADGLGEADAMCPLTGLPELQQ
jgi:hypothetical protein